LLCKTEQVLGLAHDTNYKKKSLLKFLRNNLDKPITFNKYLPKDFIFYPCQLSNDAQIILNSPIDNCEAINIAKRIADKSALDLVVKLHPSEANVYELSRITSLQQELGFTLTNVNTYEALNSCASVVTINSTLGIEAKAIGKTVHVLGDAIYSSWDQVMAINYFENVLFDIDYFSPEKLDLRYWKVIAGKLGF